MAPKKRATAATTPMITHLIQRRGERCSSRVVTCASTSWADGSVRASLTARSPLGGVSHQVLTSAAPPALGSPRRWYATRSSVLRGVRIVNVGRYLDNHRSSHGGGRC